MKHLLKVVAIVVTLSIAEVSADVRMEEKTRVQFGGMMGRIVGLFGGQAAREGVVSTVAVQGDRKMTRSAQTGQIIDLAEEKVYDLDLRRKTYTVTTFAELRKQMLEAQQKAEKEAAQASDAPRQNAEQKQLEIDFELKESGQTKTISGYDTREIVMTITVREKDKTLEESGGIVMTSHSWLAPRIDALREIGDFDRRYAAKMELPMMAGASATQVAAALAMYPGLQEAMGKFQVENINLDGTPILTEVIFEAVRNAAEMAQARKEEEAQSGGAGGGVRGALGGLGRRVARKPASDANANRAAVLTMNAEVLKVSTAVGDGDVAIPAGFEQK